MHRFEEFTLRPTTAEDRELARTWTDADRWHRGRMAPDAWLENTKGVETHMLADEHGEVMFVRMERLTRVYIQFPPTGNRAERDRIRRALTKGLDWLALALGLRGYGEILFDSTSPLLRRFAADKLGFQAKPDTLIRRIAIWSPKEAPEADFATYPASEAQTPPVGAPVSQGQGAN